MCPCCLRLLQLLVVLVCGTHTSTKNPFPHSPNQDRKTTSSPTCIIPIPNPCSLQKSISFSSSAIPFLHNNPIPTHIPLYLFHFHPFTGICLKATRDRWMHRQTDLKPMTDARENGTRNSWEKLVRVLYRTAVRYFLQEFFCIK